MLWLGVRPFAITSDKLRLWLACVRFFLGQPLTRLGWMWLPQGQGRLRAWSGSSQGIAAWAAELLAELGVPAA